MICEKVRSKDSEVLNPGVKVLIMCICVCIDMCTCMWTSVGAVARYSRSHGAVATDCEPLFEAWSPWKSTLCSSLMSHLSSPNKNH